ncbi:imidazoleglycerol-phosphate dehydratase HisB [Paenibacillus xylaniclasticus]|uniref:imidazoleglycerol-phosphate dehydratase HisB n=1 Tax=Paenibacillus xylaniclasticus TaxID=588083 RepID=UPI000FDAE7A2|nr:MULTISPECIES: imidazoleglycerol-phosphate dehydratase HisB [Paenibacillus]GFN32288.1 imidazoleglycerol-phosphate dehydratase [Paenibacillus curdlanolyticus]
MAREALIKRTTKETDITLKLNLDEFGESSINSGIGFFDHMLTLFAFRAGITLHVDCQGDLEIDGHHTVEDIGICLGQAIKKALGDKRGINRYGSSRIPMDESLAVVDLSVANRSFLVFNAEMPSPLVGGYETELTEEFFHAVANNGGITIHINLEYGKNTHHINEAIFVAFGDALRKAVQITSDRIPSTKGTLSV